MQVLKRQAVFRKILEKPPLCALRVRMVLVIKIWLWFWICGINLFGVNAHFLRMHSEGLNRSSDQNELPHPHHHHNHSSEWDCHRPWPSLTLFMPFKIIESPKHPRYYEIENVFFKTFLLFWPLKISNTSLLLAYDGESSGSSFVNMIQDTISALVAWRVPGGATMVGIPPFPYYNHGYNRQQYNMFWADNFTTTEYIGFVDTDTAFITYVDREDLFEDNKPVINARSGYRDPDDGIACWIIADSNAMQLLEPMICMSYFPVIVKADHLKGLRAYLAKLYNTSFDEVFHHQIERGYFSQFGIMCIYLWNFHRDEYVWYTHSETPDWDGIHPPPVPGLDGNVSQFTPAMKVPKPRIAIHFNHRSTEKHYMTDLHDSTAYQDFLRKGYCYSPPFPHNESACASVNPLKYYNEMHNFDEFSYESVNKPEEMDLQAVKRHHRLKHCQPTWNQDEIKAFL